MSWKKFEQQFRTIEQPKSHDPLSFRACQDESLCHAEHLGTEVLYHLFHSDLSTYPWCIPSTYAIDYRSQLFIMPFLLPTRQSSILKTYIRGTATAKLRSSCFRQQAADQSLLDVSFILEIMIRWSLRALEDDGLYYAEHCGIHTEHRNCWFSISLYPRCTLTTYAMVSPHTLCSIPRSFLIKDYSLLLQHKYDWAGPCLVFLQNDAVDAHTSLLGTTPKRLYALSQLNSTYYSQQHTCPGQALLSVSPVKESSYCMILSRVRVHVNELCMVMSLRTSVSKVAMSVPTAVRTQLILTRISHTVNDTFKLQQAKKVKS